MFIISTRDDVEQVNGNAIPEITTGQHGDYFMNNITSEITYLSE